MQEFSRIIAGTMTWGVWGSNLNTAQMAANIEGALALGVHTFDHADIYGGYTTEAAFGRAFAQTGIAREDVFFISKCGIQYPCEARPIPIKHYDYSPEHIRFSVENSLRHLQTDYLDLLLLHRPSPLMDPEPIVAVLHELIEAHKIKSWGVSNFTPSQCALFERFETPQWNQIECSLTHNAPLLDGSLDHHQAQSIGTMAWSPLGIYFKEKTEAVTRIQKVLKPLCEKYQADESQLLLAWLLRHPAQIHPVVGTTQLSRLKKSVAALDIPLATEDWFVLTEASWGHRAP